jgi:hypothetical protein
MKKYLFILLFAAINCSYSFSQTYSATLSIKDIDIKDLKPGDQFTMPVILKEKTGGKITGLQLFIGFDHALFAWNGTADDPESGIKQLHKAMPYLPNDWVFNDNGSQMAGAWIDPNYKGIDIKNGDVIVEYIFTYKGGLKPGGESDLIWGDKFEIIDGRATQGATEITSELIDTYILKNINGKIICSK